MTDRLMKALAKENILVTDCGTGTEVEKLNLMQNYDLWSTDAVLNHPEAIYDIHMNNLKAGANILTTATYQGNPHFLKEKGVQETDLITKAVAIDQKVRTDFEKAHPDHQTILIAGSVGPYGAYLNDGSEYTGKYHLSKPAFQDFHLPQVKLLNDAGVDFLAIETNPNFAEIQALVELVENEFPNLKTWVSISINDQFDLADGTPLKTVVNYLNQANAVDAIGVNCTDINNISPLLDKLTPLTNKPIVVYPNNGDTYDLNTRTWVNGEDKIDFSEGTKQWLAKGARIIGGCCRTSPADIEVIRNEVNQVNSK